MIFKEKTDIFGKAKIGTNEKWKGLFDGLFDGLFNGGFLESRSFDLSEVLSESDIAAIKNYNSELEKVIGYTFKQGKEVAITQSAQTAYNKTMLDASENAQNLVRSATGEKVALDGLTKSSKAAELGMKALAVAGNILVSLVINPAKISLILRNYLIPLQLPVLLYSITAMVAIVSCTRRNRSLIFMVAAR